MERTISLAPFELGLLTAERLKAYDAVYLGGEFCEGMLPSPADYGKLAAIFPGRVVTVTSIMSDHGLGCAADLLKKYLGKQRTFEIVVNDWGLLRLLRDKYSGARPILGRLIIWEIARMDKRFLNSFCREYGITAVEADCEDVLKRLSGFRGSINYHGPWRFRSTTRFCPHIKAFNSAPCTRACGVPPRRLRNPKVLGEDIYNIGNAYFTPNRPAKHRLIRRTVETFTTGPKRVSNEITGRNYSGSSENAPHPNPPPRGGREGRG